MSKTLRHALRVFLGGLVLCASAPPAFSVGGQFGLEFAIDAPWRLEPVADADGTYSYGPIPIVVSFHDAVFEVARNKVSSFTDLNPIQVGKLREIRVTEWTQDQPHPRQPVTIIPAGELREIESKRLVSTKTAEPDHDICRPSASQSCNEVLDITSTHEWYGMFWYRPQAAVTPGRNIHLEVVVVTELPGGLYMRQWRNYLVVHAGEKPLPRFSKDWLYGDFHYHSQMTDNEGESGYSYRAVARALGAMGMDFVFATDHASNGFQIDGAIDSQYCADRSLPKCLEARDFNAARFRAAKSLLYGPDGINAAIELDEDTGGLARLRADNILPQVYLGEEADAIPEISKAEFDAGIVKFGDGLRYRWPDVSQCVRTSGQESCKRKYSKAVGGNYLLLDEQGIPVEERAVGWSNDTFGNETVNSVVRFFTPDLTRAEPSRQHMVYFPLSISQNVDGWVGSDTGLFGSGGKRLTAMLREMEGKGYAFLAHPLDNLSPGGPEGPDIVPYSDAQLTQAWQSPAILGLQFWNENDQHASAPDRRSPTVMFTGALEDDPRTTQFSYNWPYQGHQFGNFPWSWQRAAGQSRGLALYHGAYTWDRYLRKGLDPQQTASVAWLKQGEPRKWYMAGGSDSHGDFNYRRYGRPSLDRWSDVPVADTAIGNPRNLISMASPPGAPALATSDTAPARPGPRRFSNQEVVASLQAGRFSVTDGPAVRIAIDRNLNGKVDDQDLPMGATLDFYPGDRIPLLVEWQSSPEFGPIARVDVYVGNKQVTFAPAGHGPGIPGGRGEAGNYSVDPSKALQVQLADNFGRFSRAPLPADLAYHGVAQVFLGPAQFQLAQADKSLSYVRAFVTTIARQQAADLGVCASAGTAGSMCGNRIAYSNPIWNRYNATCPAGRPRPNIAATTALGGSARAFVDGNQNGRPDACEDVLQNACPTGSRVNRGEVGPRADTADRSPSTSQPGPARPIPKTSCQRLGTI